MSAIRACPVFLIVAAVAAGLTAGAALAQSSPPGAGQGRTASEPSAATRVENWTNDQWNAAKRKWSQNKARWDACNRDSTKQNLSGRKSWSFLYDCMNKA